MAFHVCATNLCATDLRATNLPATDLCATDLCAPELRTTDLRAICGLQVTSRTQPGPFITRSAIAAGVVALTWNENEVDRPASPGLGQLATTFEVMNKPLEVGQTFPTINAKDMDGNAVDLASLGTGSWTVVLFYRGHW